MDTVGGYADGQNLYNYYGGVNGVDPLGDETWDGLQKAIQEVPNIDSFYNKYAKNKSHLGSEPYLLTANYGIIDLVHLARGIQVGLGAANNLSTDVQKNHARRYAISKFEEEFQTSWGAVFHRTGKFIALRGAPGASVDDLPSDSLGFYIGIKAAQNGGDWKSALLEVIKRTEPIQNQRIVDRFIENVGTNLVQGSGLGVAAMRHGKWEYAYPKSEAHEIIKAAEQVNVKIDIQDAETDKAQILNAKLKWYESADPKIIIEKGKETIYAPPPGYIFSK